MWDTRSKCWFHFRSCQFHLWISYAEHQLCSGTGSDRGHDHMRDWHVATPGLIHSELEWALLLALHMFFRFLKRTGSKGFFSLPFFCLQKPEPVVLSFFINFKETGTRVITSVARFLNAHPILKPVLTMRTENWFLYIYIYGRTGQVLS